MSIKGKAYIVGAFEHPTRDAPAQDHRLAACRERPVALADACLTIDDVEGYFCAGEAPGFGTLAVVATWG